MESITIYVNNKEQKEMLYLFLQHLDFVVFPETKQRTKQPKTKEYSIFDSAGIWKNRTITLTQLRAKAWKRN